MIVIGEDCQFVIELCFVVEGKLVIVFLGFQGFYFGWVVLVYYFGVECFLQVLVELGVFYYVVQCWYVFFDGGQVGGVEVVVVGNMDMQDWFGVFGDCWLQVELFVDLLVVVGQC